MTKDQRIALLEKMLLVCFWQATELSDNAHVYGKSESFSVEEIKEQLKHLLNKLVLTR